MILFLWILVVYVLFLIILTCRLAGLMPSRVAYTDQSYSEQLNNNQAMWERIDGTELPLIPDTLKQWVDFYASVVLPCKSSENPDYLAHLNAPNIARDLDLIRNLTGFKTLDYYGLEYGSLVGVNYAALFPDQVGHMVLDGICPHKYALIL